MKEEIKTEEGTKVTFNGLTALNEETGERYPINGNYISRSMLVPGDILMMRTDPWRGVMYKLYEKAPRITSIATVKSLNGELIALSEGYAFKILKNIITFYKLEDGSKIMIVFNPYEKTYCAVEGLISKRQ